MRISMGVMESPFQLRRGALSRLAEIAALTAILIFLAGMMARLL